MFGRDEKVSPVRLTAVQYIILVVFLFLAYGLWRLQVVQSEFYSAAAEKNMIREVPILAPRGKILDREGRVIVDNYPSFSALLLRDSTRDLNADADVIAQGLHLEPKEVRDRIRSMPGCESRESGLCSCSRRLPPGRRQLRRGSVPQYRLPRFDPGRPWRRARFRPRPR